MLGPACQNQRQFRQAKAGRRETLGVQGMQVRGVGSDEQTVWRGNVARDFCTLPILL